MQIKLADSRNRYIIKNPQGYMRRYHSMDVISGSDGIVKKIILNKKVHPELRELVKNMPVSIKKIFLQREVTSPLEISLYLGYLK